MTVKSTSFEDDSKK